MARVHPHPSERPLDYYERLEASVDELVASAEANTAAVTKGMSNFEGLFRLIDIYECEHNVTCALLDVLLSDSIKKLAKHLRKLLALTTIQPKEAWRVRLRRFLRQIRRDSKEFAVNVANNIGVLVLGVGI